MTERFEGIPWSIVSYNAQRCRRAARWAEITTEFRSTAVWAVQGTRERFDHQGHYRRMGKFHTYSWGYGRGQGTNKACGVTLGLHSRPFKQSHVKRVYTFPLAFEGRLGALRIRNRVLDLFLVVVYMPVNPATEHARHVCESVSRQLGILLSSAPARTVPIVGGDFNAHIGRPFQGASSDETLVGPFGPWATEAENFNGAFMRGICMQHRLTWVSTHHSTGPTTMMEPQKAPSILLLSQCVCLLRCRQWLRGLAQGTDCSSSTSVAHGATIGRLDAYCATGLFFVDESSSSDDASDRVLPLEGK